MADLWDDAKAVVSAVQRAVWWVAPWAVSRVDQLDSWAEQWGPQRVARWVALWVALWVAQWVAQWVASMAGRWVVSKAVSRVDLLAVLSEEKMAVYSADHSADH